MVNALTRKAGLTLGPIIFETLLKHYFDRVAKDHESGESTRLRREELLYDEAFNIIKRSIHIALLACPSRDAIFSAWLSVAMAMAIAISSWSFEVHMEPASLPVEKDEKTKRDFGQPRNATLFT
uniref:Hormone-sensitive lipase n=1 Tax=Ganoderma boninense TaxID=34458 RepID=A0A5K1JZV7_9APHY|nr:Hormone-sensitive lipase [Ganoderma boninense]